jgi:hypothetical protein
LVPEDKGINVALEGGALTALIQSLDGRWSQYYPAGHYELPAPGWYTLQVGEFSTFGTTTFPQTTVTYAERYRDDGIDLGGVSLPPIQKTSTTIARGTKNLGALSTRVLLQIISLDDLLNATLDDDTTLLDLTFNKTGIYEFTQRIPIGSHSLKLTVRDKNKGKCWGLAYRFGDATAWKHADHCGNISCRRPLPKGKTTVYTITFNFVMRA